MGELMSIVRFRNFLKQGFFNPGFFGINNNRRMRSKQQGLDAPSIVGDKSQNTAQLHAKSGGARSLPICSDPEDWHMLAVAQKDMAV